MIQNDAINTPIDAVILWVDGNDKGHKKKMIPFLKDKKILDEKSFRTRFDQVDEIEYTVNSIIKFANYVRNIFIVTDNQVPDFLKKSNTNNKYNNVFVIDHSIIFDGYQQFLPTFNSRTLESFIFRIPNLAEHFIYLNDDFFLINETKNTDFFRNGMPVLRGKWGRFKSNKSSDSKVGHKIAQQKSAKLLGFNKYYNFKHTPHPLRKSTYIKCFDVYRDVFLKNIEYKFRSNNQLLIQGLVNHLEIKNKTCVLQNDLQLLYFRSYKKNILWYKFKLNTIGKKKLFLGLQSLDKCQSLKLTYLLGWLKNRIS